MNGVNAQPQTITIKNQGITYALRDLVKQMPNAVLSDGKITREEWDNTIDELIAINRKRDDNNKIFYGCDDKNSGKCLIVMPGQKIEFSAEEMQSLYEKMGVTFNTQGTVTVDTKETTKSDSKKQVKVNTVNYDKEGKNAKRHSTGTVRINVLSGHNITMSPEEYNFPGTLVVPQLVQQDFPVAENPSKNKFTGESAKIYLKTTKRTSCRINGKAVDINMTVSENGDTSMAPAGISSFNDIVGIYTLNNQPVQKQLQSDILPKYSINKNMEISEQKNKKDNKINIKTALGITLGVVATAGLIILGYRTNKKINKPLGEFIFMDKPELLAKVENQHIVDGVLIKHKNKYPKLDELLERNQNVYSLVKIPKDVLEECEWLIPEKTRFAKFLEKIFGTPKSGK